MPINMPEMPAPMITKRVSARWTGVGTGWDMDRLSLLMCGFDRRGAGRRKAPRRQVNRYKSAHSWSCHLVAEPEPIDMGAMAIKRTGPDSAAAEEALSSTGRRLLRVAEDVSRGRNDAGPGEMPLLSEFVQIYREWITSHRGRLGTQQQQAEGWQLICHAMITAADIGEAIGLLIRFGRVVWQERGPCELREEGDTAVLVFSERYLPGPEGLIAAVWQLTLTLCELEFLADRRFREASGRVRHTACVPDGVTSLLFAQPILYDTDEVALVFDRQHLRRPVVARPADLPRFFRELLPLTLGVRRDPPGIEAMTAGLIRDDKRGPDYRVSDLKGVASRLGLSAATLRRRLKDEGSCFRGIKETIYNELAQKWLRQREVGIEDIAARLGFSDGFAFRRFFRRLNDVSPSVWRARA